MLQWLNGEYSLLIVTQIRNLIFCRSWD